jgi:hypothetical protein
MGLDSSCKEYLNRIVIVKPVYGWGWSRLDAPEIPVPAEVNGVPHPFKCRITDFLHYQNELVGATGKIEEPSHIYDSLWTLFYLRVRGMWNFTDELGQYNLEIGPRMPEMPDGKEWPEFTSGAPMVNGYGIVAESIRHIEKYDLREHEKWEIMRDAMNSDA